MTNFGFNFDRHMVDKLVAILPGALILFFKNRRFCRAMMIFLKGFIPLGFFVGMIVNN